MPQLNFWPVFLLGPIIEIWIFKQNCKIAYVLALPEDICAILMKYVIHILKALDISYWKMKENVEIITNHILQFWTKIPKSGYCGAFNNYLPHHLKLWQKYFTKFQSRIIKRCFNRLESLNKFDWLKSSWRIGLWNSWN